MNTCEYYVDSCDVITAVNAEWLNFARQNNAWELSEEKVIGKNLWSFIGNRDTKSLYQIMLKNVRSRSKKITVSFRCDSPSFRRKMQLNILPGMDHSIHFQSVLLDEEKRKYVPLIDSRVGRGSSFVIMCSWCNCVQTGEERWEEIEDAVQRFGLFFSPVLPKISHGICPECLARVKNSVIAMQDVFKSVPVTYQTQESMLRA